MKVVREQLRKIALLIAYDGTDFSGFAKQRHARTVQGVLEERLETLLRTPTATTGAGRTDAGVHAWGQVVSFFAAAEPEWLRVRLTKWLAPEIAIRAAAVMPDGWDARFSAIGREYEYRIYRTDFPDPFLDRFMLHGPGPLHLGSMRAAAKTLLGEQDFAAFCRASGRSTVRNVRAIRISARDDMLTFVVIADSFCHQMVRSVSGTLLEVGQGKRTAESVEGALTSRKRSAAGAVAPARGLHLVRVRYPRDPFRGGS